jgi:hypothetical protein
MPPAGLNLDQPFVINLGEYAVTIAKVRGQNRNRNVAAIPSNQNFQSVQEPGRHPSQIPRPNNGPHVNRPGNNYQTSSFRPEVADRQRPTSPRPLLIDEEWLLKMNMLLGSRTDGFRPNFEVLNNEIGRGNFDEKKVRETLNERFLGQRFTLPLESIPGYEEFLVKMDRFIQDRSLPKQNGNLPDGLTEFRAPVSVT